MTWRAIQDYATDSPTLAKLTSDAERLFWRVLAKTDPWGRMRGEPEIIRGACVPMLPWTANKVEKLVLLLEDVDLVARYNGGKKKYLAVVGFDEHQPKDLLRKRTASIYPAPPESSGQPPENSALEVEVEKDLKPLSETSVPTRQEVQEIYDCWRQERQKTHGRYNTISPKRREKIKARLKEFSLDELCQAIRAVASDPWEDRAKHDDLLVIFRSREQVERFLGMAESNKQLSPAEQLRASAARRGLL